ncbi:MAG: hypothetical protein FJZ47_19320 [Candidatus Tectomicrobia bacterium]|uniref:Uncharacterized protein n=1 Tax=Tectimicrobiota bacterium TaxID=2528274 RepID=A0A938B2C6_UNCTE|nr:hypothetical protein [Candidatus Tectomicrobia bacterium]
MLTFPSLEWFAELARVMNANEADFRRLGYADVTWGVEVQALPSTPLGRCFRLVFEEYGCAAVEERAPDDLGEIAFSMQATYATWKEMIQNIQTHNGPDLHHTLNYLALPDDPIYIAAPDFLSRDLFARYGQTYQLFFNGAVHVPTEFPV